MSRALFRLLASLLLLLPCPALAAVTVTFWSQELGENFPHAFITLNGTPDAGGEPVDMGIGFTAKSLTPAILMGSVAGKVEAPKRSYILKSDAHFAVVLTDAQYAAIRSLAEEWGEQGDHHYNLNRRNCVHFVGEAARRAGLAVTEPARLMKKPRSFLVHVAGENAGKVAAITLNANDYLASLAPAPPTVAATTDAAQTGTR